jgi:adenylate kinase
VFRNVDTGSKLGKTFIEYSSKGLLVPDEPTVAMWSEHMYARTVMSLYKPNVDLLVLDGIPRNVSQAKILEKHIKVLKIIHLVCPDEEKMIERLRKRAIKENRMDDARDEVIRKRWEVYKKETAPVLDFYPKELIAEVNAQSSPAQVLIEVLKVCVPVQQQHFTTGGDGSSDRPKAGKPSSNGVHKTAPLPAKASSDGKRAVAKK